MSKRKVSHFVRPLVLLGCVLVFGSTFLIILHHQQSLTNSTTASVQHEANNDEPLQTSTPHDASSSTFTPDAKHDAAIAPVVNGLAPVISHIVTKEPVVFLGIDDGANKQPFELHLMQSNNVQASLFLANRFIQNNPLFFKDFIAAGSLIEDHTLHHPLLSHLSYNQQKQEICGMADLEQQEFGRRPILFRPPGGDYNRDTQRAAASCGMKAVVLWIAKANGGSMQYQVGHSLKPGDIVLMHFRPEFKADMNAFLAAKKSSGLHTELLENWL
jgi:peptidoglycan/xylan/chitin deacetylase (PgdA/CDA1 family)